MALWTPLTAARLGTNWEHRPPELTLWTVSTRYICAYSSPHLDKISKSPSIVAKPLSVFPPRPTVFFLEPTSDLD